ncbi:unnamed protein product, partial [Mesorhabditis belari]
EPENATRRRAQTVSFGSLGDFPWHSSRSEPLIHDDLPLIRCTPTQRRPIFESGPTSVEEMGSRKESAKMLTIEEPQNVVDIDEHDDDEEDFDQTPKELILVPKRLRCAVSFRADDTDKWGAQQMDAHEDYSLTLRDPSVKVELLERLNTFRRNKELCDVVLFVKEREIYAHKVVLASVSPALCDMFLRDNSERARSGSNGGGSTPPGVSTPTSGAPPPPTTTTTVNGQQMAYFEFAQTDYDCFLALVNYAYTAYLEISSKKVAELYKTAYALQMTHVAKACASYLAENLSIHNCIGIRRQANFNKDTILVDKVDTYITENFAQIAEESSEFPQLSVVKTRIIIPLDEMQSKRFGQSLAERTLKYFENYKSQRGEHNIDQIAGKSHLLYFEADHLADCADLDDRSSVGSCDIIQDYKKSGKKTDTSQQALELRAAPPQHRGTGATAVRLDASRVPNDKYGSTESLDSVGSGESDPENTISTRLLAVHQTSPDYWMALVVLYHRLVVLSIQITDDEELGGKNGPKQNGVDAQKQHLLNKLVSAAGAQRKPLPTMSGARASIGAVFLEGKIIVCGGYDRGECLKSVEEYDVVKGAWKQLTPMNDERGRFDTAVIKGKVYAVAGSNGNHDLKTSEVFDSKTGKWSPIKSLNKARSHNGCAVLDDVLYCVGGSNDQVVMRDCEKYDVDRDEWTAIPPMVTGRYQAGVVAWKGLLVAVGGCDRWACIDTVEAFDPKVGQWRELPKLRTPRRGCAVAVVRDILYIIGGHDGTNSLSTVEVLDHPNGQWRAGPVLTTPRANTHAVVTAGNVIYVIGGFNGVQFLNTIELLESESVGWCNYQQQSMDFTLAEEEEEGDGLERDRSQQRSTEHSLTPPTTQQSHQMTPVKAK